MASLRWAVDRRELDFGRALLKSPCRRATALGFSARLAHAKQQGRPSSDLRLYQPTLKRPLAGLGKFPF